MTGEAINHHSAEHLERAIRSRFPCVHYRAHDSSQFSYSDGSAKKVDGGSRNNQDGHEVAGTYTGTGLVMAGTQQVLRIDPNGKDTTNTINRAELVGVQAWLKCISQDEHPLGSTFKMLTAILKAVCWRRCF